MKVIISDQPESTIQKVEYIENKRLIQKLHRDISSLVDSKEAQFSGRAINNSNNLYHEVYQIFNIDNKRILIEDKPATEMLRTLYDKNGNIREFKIEDGVKY